MELAKEVERAIIERQIAEKAQQIYDAVIRRKVAERVSDETMKKKLDDVLVKLEKENNVLNELLSEKKE